MEKTTEAADPIYASKEYKRSRWAYTFECMFEYFVTLMVGGSFLAKLLTSLGFDSGTTGLISSLVSLAFLFQLAAVFIVKRITNTKAVAVTVHCIGQLVFMSLFFLPLLPVDPGLRKVLCIAGIMIAYFGNYLVTAVIYKWGNSFVPANGRGEFNATKEIISLVGGMLVTFGAGYVIDRFEEKDNLTGAFLFIAISALVYSLCDFICLMNMKNEKRPAETARRIPFRMVLRYTVGNKGFRQLCLMASLFAFSNYFTLGFISVYEIKDLGMSMVLIQVVNVGSQIMRVLVSRPLGKFSDRHSYLVGMELGFVIAVVAYLCLALTTPGSWWIIFPYAALHSASAAATGQNNIIITFNYVGEDFYVEATAIKNSISGVVGFGAAFLASQLVSTVEQNGNVLWGIPVYGQQITATISAVMMLSALLYARLVMGKRKAKG